MSEEPDHFTPTRRQWFGFWVMIFQQTQNAFNDKMAQFILVPLGCAIGYSIESEASILIALPFVVFAPMAGWLSDRFSKRNVMVGSAVFQLVALAWLSWAIYIHHMPLAITGFVLLATQATFFSPAKIGINKELVGSQYLGFASGIQQMTSMLAMLSGQIVAGWLFDKKLTEISSQPHAPWLAALSPTLFITLLSIPTVLLALSIPKVSAQSNTPFSLKLTVSHFAHLKDLWSEAKLRQTSLGVAFFWGFAAFINLWSLKLAKVISGGGLGFGTISSLFMVAASAGMITGFGTAAYLLRKRIELGWVPLAGGVMAVLSIVLAIFPLSPAGDFIHLFQHPIQSFHLYPTASCFLVLLALLAFSSAVFLAPLNAHLQDQYPHEKRGELQAAANVQDCMAGILAVAFIASIEALSQWLRIDALQGCRIQIAIMGAACVAATMVIIRILPADFIRLIGISVVRAFYMLRVSGLENVPAKGGVLLLPNHVTFADSFFLSAACNRPIRFVMEEAFAENKAIRIFSRIFNTVTIKREQPLEAIRIVIKALKKGDVICLFPEGQLTRTGSLAILQRGVEVIAQKAKHPIIPVWCDGSWGSIFSFERNRYFKKIPRNLPNSMHFAFGKAMPPEDVTVESVRNALLIASCSAIQRRFASKAWLKRSPKQFKATQAFKTLDANTRKMIWINGHQIGAVNALQHKQKFNALKNDPILESLLSACATFPSLFLADIQLKDEFDGNHSGVWVGTETSRLAIKASQINGSNIVFYDFSQDSITPIERAGLTHLPCLAINHRVISMSMPNPPIHDDNFETQFGKKSNSVGKLLPGWFVETDEETIKIYGPAAPEGIELPSHFLIDEEGFILKKIPRRRRLN